MTSDNHDRFLPEHKMLSIKKIELFAHVLHLLSSSMFQSCMLETLKIGNTCGREVLSSQLHPMKWTHIFITYDLVPPLAHPPSCHDEIQQRHSLEYQLP